MGTSEERMATIFWALNHSDVPAGHFLPTHCCRSPELIAEGVELTKMGGTIDFTAELPDNEAGTAAALCSALRMGADPAFVTMSSDGGGSQPAFNEAGECIGLCSATSVTLLQELRRMIRREGLDLQTALRFFTENPARVIGQAGKKGTVAVGADADLLVLDNGYQVRHVMAKGKIAVWNGAAVMKGYFGT
jgi:beta-aspartyl-dipeptidase (metallo-type)